jgi:hypothetical protein
MKIAKPRLLAPRRVGVPASAFLLAVGLLVAAPAAAYASATSCYGGSCEAVTGSGLHVSSTDTYANSPHCNQTLGTTQFDQKGYITQYSINPHYVSGCSTVAMNLGWNVNLPGNDAFYGQSYYSGGWQGIATVNVHS